MYICPLIYEIINKMKTFGLYLDIHVFIRACPQYNVSLTLPRTPPDRMKQLTTFGEYM